jgi:hypothetical protein
MKKTLTILSTIILLTFSSQAQTENSGPTTKAVYGEFLGSGLVFSANFDTRFKGHKGFGLRAGVGFAGGDGSGIVTFPLGLNYLAGRGPHYFEIGASATLVSQAYSSFDDDDESSSSWFFHPHFGYRYTKPSNSFNGRIYVGPIIGDGFAFFPFGGISVGYTLPYRKK